MFRKRIIVVAQERLQPEDLVHAFAVPDDNLLWRGLLQIIEEAIQEANDAAQKTVANHGICVSFCGGAEHLARLRDQMFALREQAKLVKTA